MQPMKRLLALSQVVDASWLSLQLLQQDAYNPPVLSQMGDEAGCNYLLEYGSYPSAKLTTANIWSEISAILISAALLFHIASVMSLSLCLVHTIVHLTNTTPISNMCTQYYHVYQCGCKQKGEFVQCDRLYDNQSNLQCSRTEKDDKVFPQLLPQAPSKGGQGCNGIPGSSS